jgi:DNA modification methylase
VKIHPAADVLPALSEKDFQELCDDIAKHGLLAPIELLDGKVIDGRHRLKACKAAKVEPRFVDVELGSQSPGQYVWSLNGVRRHLSQSQKAIVAAELEPHFAVEAKERQGHRSDIKAKLPERSNGQARDKAAAAVGVSPRYASDAKAIIATAPAVAAEVKAGTITISRAKQKIKKDAQRKELAEKSASVKVDPTSDCRILLGDCLDELPKLKNVRLVFADPPYNIGVDYGNGKKSDTMPADKYLAWCNDWITKSANTLTKDGSFWLMVPDEYAEHFAVMMNDTGLHRRAWIKWYETFGNNLPNNFNRTSRHIFYYVVNPKRFVFNPDAVTRPSARQEKYNDKRAVEGGKIWDDVWQIPRVTGTSKERMPDFPTQLPLQMLLAIVGCASEPGDLVVDPFAGSGTTGVASKQLKRRFVGIEKGEHFWEKASVRLATT